MSTELEYELKFLAANPSNLRHFVNDITQAYKEDIIKDRNVVVDTNYFDTPAQAFKNNGYSLRHRPKNPKDGYVEKFELKAMEGHVNDFSARLELQQLILSPENRLTDYFNLLASPDFPYDIPKPTYSDLRIQFMTHAPRWEILFKMPLEHNKTATLEMVFDSIKYCASQEIIRLNNPLPYNKENYPITFDQENEVEIEIKEITDGKGATLDITPNIANEIKRKILKIKGETDDIWLTTRSKAIRGYEYLAAYQATLPHAVDITTFKM
jgi:hypothetical protein